MDKTPFLSILIPTYNRCAFLRKNLDILKSILAENSFEDKVEIIISNNHSVDNTAEMLSGYDFNGINHRIFEQKENKGPIFNCLFLLNAAISKFIMYLGDDDYLDKEYLSTIIPGLEADENLYCVLPATKSLYSSGEITPGRDYYKRSKIYAKGFRNCLENSWRGTQLSGVVCVREDLYASYQKQEIDNLYPFVYFVAVSCLNGKTWHLTDYPVTITQMEKAAVNVDYGSANLVPDIYDNYKKLKEISYLQRVLLEIKVLREQPWRYLEYLKEKGPKGLLNFIIVIFKDKSASLATKVLLPYLIVEGLAARTVLALQKSLHPKERILLSK